MHNVFFSKNQVVLSAKGNCAKLIVPYTVIWNLSAQFLFFSKNKVDVSEQANCAKRYRTIYWVQFLCINAKLMI